MSNKSGGYIELAKLNEDSIVVEELKDFPKSIFNAVYEKAQLLLDDIVKENRKIREKNKDMDTELLVNNVISFEGRRGTGKTSVMLSFRKSLEKYRSKDAFGDACFEGRKKYRQGIRFSTIAYIDASKLERGEQLLALVLANMFQQLRERDHKAWKREADKNQHNELYRLFDEVYGSVLSLKNMKKDYQDESPLRALTQLSNSQILQKNIRRLIKMYLRYMEEDEASYAGNTESYLVITIDDLDMYFQEKGESPFEMLETLHRYLMIPGVIVLVTYNSKDLQIGCEKHFGDIYHSKYEKLEKGEVEKQVDHIQDLTSQYLKKVLPIHMRIHMVSWRKKDYGTDREIKILLRKKEIEEYLGEFASYFPEKAAKERVDEEQSVLLTHKKFLFLLKAAATGIFYDACGEKRHYSEATSFRELAHMFEYYKYMGNLQNENYKYKELLDGLYFRFTKEHLRRSEPEEFDKFLAVPFYRRSKDILMYLRQRCWENSQQELSKIQYVGKAETSYSYGELLYGLYEASKNGWISKQMVWCILDSYTIMMTKYYRNLITAGEDEKKAKKKKDDLMKIIGASVASSWSNLFLPEWKIIDKKQNSGSVNETDEKLKEKSYTIDGVMNNKEINKENRFDEKRKVVFQVGAVKFSQTTRFSWKSELPVSSDENELAEYLHQYEILNLFFSDVYHDSLETKVKKSGFSIKFIPNRLSEKLYEELPAADKEPELQMNCTDACFNIMNFVHNLFRGKEFFAELHENLKPQFEGYFLKLRRYLKENQDIDIEWLDKEKVKTFLEENSLYKQYKEWFDESHGLAMPVYSFDMMYNVFKRYNQNRMTSHRVPDEEAIWENVKEVYHGIGKILNEEDWFYYTNRENEVKDKNNQEPVGKFLKYYQNSLFIDYIEKYGNEERFKKRFTEMMDGIRSLLVNKNK